jgi:hypothetical protein
VTVVSPTVLVETTVLLNTCISAPLTRIYELDSHEDDHEICIKMMSGDAFYEYVTNLRVNYFLVCRGINEGRGKQTRASNVSGVNKEQSTRIAQTYSSEATHAAHAAHATHSWPWPSCRLFFLAFHDARLTSCE